VHPLNAYLAQAVMDDRRAHAERRRRAARSREATRAEQYESVTVRRARPGDSPALRVLAERGRGRLPRHPALVAEVDGAVLAARSLADGAAVADPSRPTAQLRELLALRAAQLRGEREPPGPGKLGQAARRLRGLGRRPPPAGG
jgi:hypothetical protein